MTRPTYCYFDLGNVLVHFDNAIAQRQLATVVGTTPAEVKTKIYNSGLQNRYETGELTCQQYADEVNHCFESNAVAEDIWEAISAMFTPNLTIIPWLEKLKKASVPMGILSNTCHAHWDWIGRQTYPMMDGFFGHSVLSYEVRSMKPDSMIYTRAAELAGRQPEELFFTDDREENVAAARAAGWQAEIFTDSDALGPHLERWFLTT